LGRLDGCNFHVTTCSTNKIVVMFSLSQVFWDTTYLCIVSANAVLIVFPCSNTWIFLVKMLSFFYAAWPLRSVSVGISCH
jgi:hypothetical protein